MLLDVSIVKSGSLTNPGAACSLHIGNQYQDTIPEELANSFIALYKLKLSSKIPSSKFKNNVGMFDTKYS